MGQCCRQQIPVNVVHNNNHRLMLYINNNLLMLWISVINNNINQFITYNSNHRPVLKNNRHKWRLNNTNSCKRCTTTIFIKQCTSKMLTEVSMYQCHSMILNHLWHELGTFTVRLQNYRNSYWVDKMRTFVMFSLVG